MEQGTIQGVHESRKYQLMPESEMTMDSEKFRNSSGWMALLEWMYEGVDHTLPGNGGRECVEFLGVSQRIVESSCATLFSLFVMWLAYPRLTLPKISYDDLRDNQIGKRLLLVIMCLTFGIELGFKFATRQFIWVFNPCHVATVIQIFLLAAPPSKAVTAMFRLHMHMLTGAPIAVLFPVVNTRLLPMETEVYYIQHILMLVIPFYLLKTGGAYIPENILDFTWGFMSLGILYIYHFVPLQLLAYFSTVNLNNMLCPAVSDPFHGPYYRLCALTHQTILIPCLGKVYVLIANHLPVWRAQSKKHIQEVSCWEGSNTKYPHQSNHARGDHSSPRGDNSHQQRLNGHVKTS
ncbi:transmembrane protein 164-like isoform X1 [Haliotis rubra]|uniref:transmembrane protein 164-like isoform X1 n=2 Tax=Haliotis rubra TaxID=36100 RepID=UPI001EE5B41E|nr:transmembrane protein 164-like isoform X1 [Haliotis rubra]